MVLFALSMPAGAREEKTDSVKIQAAKALLIEMGGTRSFDKLMIRMSQRLLPVMQQQYPGKEKLVGEVMDNAMKKVLKEHEADKVEMVRKTATIYASHFSVGELNEITAFYKTATGKKLVAKLPLIANETMQTNQAWAQKLATDIIGKFGQEADKRGLKRPARPKSSARPENSGHQQRPKQ